MSGILQAVIAGQPNYILNAEVAFSGDTEITPTDATASISFLNTGAVTEINGAGFTLVTHGDPAGLDIYVSGAGTTPTGSAINSWLNLGTTRTWTLTELGIGLQDFLGTYQIREAASGIVLASNTFQITAEVDV